MSPDVFRTLEGSLVEKHQGIERLVALAEENRDALIAHDVDAIIRINEQQTDELSRLDRLQRASTRLLSRLASALGVEGEGVCLSAVAARLPEEQRTRLEQLSSALTEGASRLASISEANALLSANALEFIRITLSAVSDVSSADAERPANGSLVLDAQV